MMHAKILPYLLGLCVALGSASAWALPNDRDQPIRIQADNAHLDDKLGVATYTGDVIITQGSTIFKGNTVTITRTASGDIDVLTSVGNLAYFEQQQSPAKPDKVKGWAVTIQYQARKSMVILTDRAKVENEGNSTEGEKVVYNTMTQVATGGRGGNVTAPRQRIDMVIHPKKKSE
ncbi:lipopolysaccharide transport periplasmic protein LptA [Myxococcus sp. CA056]|uniref:lipopolysaccharide transport periplasmic protein LptA n=1 Tax=unclassified Myxococcus TaxID=2648731 RepID=UPI00157B9EC1|nr:MULTISPECIES: lipopolysaccharide transport periplasmic protein LptA [unclassified Myxococcus]NTX17728.1 lipopolysaccharide transport periplasmic protein LptA [Myxococcus sp. CA056]NTX41458.1 lipopolysaccharide transport periplasmic protein LptA [Myxococcus sp. CA033]